MSETPRRALFQSDEIETRPPREKAVGAPRLREANRSQLELRSSDLESTISEDHKVRVVWDFVCRLDLSELYGRIRAREGHVGRAVIDPKIMLSLWLYATLDGVGSARALEKFCDSHDVYRWICGGVSVNYHTLADFRVDHGAFLDQLLTRSIAALMAEGLVEMNRVSQDGVKVRASAGAASFRRKGRLENFLDEAQEQVDALKKEMEEDPARGDRRRRAARERAAQERQQRVEEALKHIKEVEEKKKNASEKEKARASTTDGEARVMKMADGGFRPAYNGQFATDTESMIIVGVDLDNNASDMGKMSPMLDQLQDRYQKSPSEYLVDGGFANHAEVEKVEGADKCKVYAPLQKPKNPDRDPHHPLPGDSEIVAEWRKRMGTDRAKEIYKDRASTSECVNAQARNRGLQRFLVRGCEKARTILLWFALSHNLMRAHALRLEKAASLAVAA